MLQRQRTLSPQAGVANGLICPDVSQSTDKNRLRVAPDVVSCAAAERIVALSLSTGEFASFDGVGAEIWALLDRETTQADIITELRSRYGFAATDTLARDTAAFIESLRRLGLVRHPTSFGVPESPLHSSWVYRLLGGIARSRAFGNFAAYPPGVIRATATLGLAHVLLRTVGLRRVLRLIASICPTSRRAVSPAFCSQVVRSIATASSLYPFGAACLESSVCSLAFVAAAGSRATLKLGVQVFPFRSHAWVEVAGVPMNETRDAIDRYQEIASFEV